jgi:integral membrane protein
MDLLNSHIGRLRIIGFLEGLSYLILIGIAMPLKYLGGYENATWDIGMIHGVLFISYIIAVVPVWISLKWSLATTFWAMIASLVPFGTFIADYKIFRKYSLREEKARND